MTLGRSSQAQSTGASRWLTFSSSQRHVAGPEFFGCHSSSPHLTLPSPVLSSPCAVVSLAPRHLLSAHISPSRHHGVLSRTRNDVHPAISSLGLALLELAGSIRLSANRSLIRLAARSPAVSRVRRSESSSRCLPFAVP